MGGGAIHINLPMIQFKTSSSSLHSPSSSSSPSNLNFPAVSANHSTATAPLKQSCTAAYCSCNSETCTRPEYVNKKPSGTFNNLVFGSVPSQSEVENAVTALQNFIHGISTSGPPELKWLQPVLDCCDLRALLCQGSGRVYHAFRLLQTETSVKRLVVSLSSDKAVWDAVMNNELVRKLRQSLYPAEIGRPQSSDDETDPAKKILRWILEITRTKVMELIDKFQSLVNEVFHPLDRENPTADGADLEEKVASSLLLSVVILLIVIVARAHRA